LLALLLRLLSFPHLLYNRYLTYTDSKQKNTRILIKKSLLSACTDIENILLKKLHTKLAKTNGRYKPASNIKGKQNVDHNPIRFMFIPSPFYATMRKSEVVSKLSDKPEISQW